MFLFSLLSRSGHTSCALVTGVQTCAFPMYQGLAEQILSYEGALSAYLRRVWPDPSEIADLRQEVYVRVYQGAGKRRPPVARFFLFAIARNLLIDRLRKSREIGRASCRERVCQDV